jgi:dipeptidyl aminopeptidase/acylaminoacyl peptidase
LRFEKKKQLKFKVIKMKTIKFLFVGTFLLLTVSVLSQETKRPVTTKDFFNIKNVGEPRISPDEKWIAYEVTETDLKEDSSETRIWMIATSGGEAMPMTAKGYSAGNPRWSPDGKYLSFTAAREKGERTQVWALNRLGGEAQKLTNIKQGVSGYEWSPDGKRLLLIIRDPRPELLTEDKEDDNKPKPYVIDRLKFKSEGVGYLDRRRTHFYVYTPHSEKDPIQITSGDFDDREPVWSPDGESIAFASNRTQEPDSNRNTDIWIVSADNTDKGQTLLQITKNPGRDHQPSWSPDGKFLVYKTIIAPREVDSFAVSGIALISAGGGEPSLLTPKLDRNAFAPNFSADGRSIWFMIEDDGEENLAKMNLADKKITRKVTGQTIVWSYDIKGDTVATQSSRYNLPFELFTFKNERFAQLTFTNKKLLGKLRFSEAENIKFKSKDGTIIEGYMYKPPGYNPAMKYPTILWIHGGPTSQYNAQYSHRTQLFTANGYLVLHINPRGSSGYGQDFSYAISGDWGNLDYQDVMAGVDWTIEKGFADPDRLGVGGWSYGGILTNYVITKNQRFKGAISGASLALFRANYGTDDVPLSWELEFGLPWEKAELWERVSPFNDVEKITTPTLWMGGERDWRVPVANSEQMYQAMKRLGRETQLVVYPDEAHWPMRRPTFVKDRWERYLGWFGRYVKGKSE